MNAARRIAQRYISQKLAAADLPHLLHNFGRLREGFDRPIAKTYPGAYLKQLHELAKRIDALSLFLGILQEYQLKPADRKVIERAAKTFSKGTLKLIKDQPKALAALEAAHKEYTLFYETAERALNTGKKHEESETSSTVVKASSFKLINTGGFDDKVMQDVANVVEKAERLLRQKGLGKVCYGNIHVTNTVRKSTRVLAFYTMVDDALYIRANLKGKQGPALSSVIHELGHRLHRKFLQSSDSGIQAIYRQIQNKEDDISKDKSKWPPIGSEVTEGDKTYIVKGYKFDSRYTWVLEMRNDERGVTGLLPLKGYLQISGKSPFVTSYAATSYSENFAEMIAAYCEDTLPDDQTAMLKAIL